MSSNLKGNVFRKFALRSLKVNKVRTIVTLIGIMLSMALLTAVIEGANSGMKFIINSEIAVEGCWEGGFWAEDSEFVERIASDSRIKQSGTLGLVGWAEIDSEMKHKPYVVIESMEEGFTDVVSVIIVEGRMPENSSEIIIPTHLQDYNGEIEVGDEIELQVGRRTLEGSDLTTHDTIMPGEEITEPETKKYTVVGVCGRANEKIEPRLGAGYMVFTTGAGKSDVHDVYYTLKNPKKIFDFIEEHGGDNAVTHTDLLLGMGISGNSGIMKTIYGLVVILVLLIVFGSITLIYNSFSISVGERTRQFGILKSIGATKKQIRSAVLFEAFVLSVLGILAGVAMGLTGIGLTLYFLRDDFASLFTYGDIIDLKLEVSPAGLVIAALICLATVLISAWIPAKRAVKISAIDLIRQTRDVKINGKKMKTAGFITKLFGFEGMMANKNFKRNKKRSRSAIVSIFLSLLLFIAASSFSAYLVDTIEGYGYADGGADIVCYADNDCIMPIDEIARRIADVEGVDDIAYMSYSRAKIKTDREAVSEEGKKSPFFISEDDGGIFMYVYMSFIDDRAFAMLCEANGADAGRYYGERPAALLLNSIDYRQSSEKDGHGYLVNARVFDETHLPAECYVSNLEQSGFHGSQYSDESTEITVDKVIEDAGFYMGSGVPFIIMPYSRMEEITGGEESYDRRAIVMVKAENHRDVNAEILNMGPDISTFDQAEAYESTRMLVRIMNVFTFGFIIIISLIAVANIFNTISTNVMLRRREVAMMKSVGLSDRGFQKMMNYECIIYGLRGILWGLPISVFVAFIIYKVTSESYSAGFYIPWYTLVVAIGSVFAVIFTAMWYASAKIKKDNVIDALKNENI